MCPCFENDLPFSYRNYIIYHGIHLTFMSIRRKLLSDALDVFSVATPSFRRLVLHSVQFGLSRLI